MQAIRTSYLAATNTKPSRVKATAGAGSLIVFWDHELDTEAMHHHAAVLLQKKLGWDDKAYGTLRTGCLPDGSYCHVFA